MTRRGRLATIPLLSLLLVAASGCSGREGPAGPAGPLHDPPHLSTITPDSGSWRNFVTLRGENFSTDPSEDLVYFDGSPATVLSSTVNEMLVIPAVATVTAPSWVGVTVIVGKQASNTLTFQVLPSGTLIDLPSGVLSRPVSIAPALDGHALYIADARAGVLRVDPVNGITARFIPDTLPSTSAIAVHPATGEVYVAYRVTVDSGTRTRVAAIDPVMRSIRIVIDEALIAAPVNDMVFDADGALYLMAVKSNGSTTIARLTADGTLEPAWSTLPCGATGMSTAMLDGTLYVSTAQGRLYRVWSGLPGPAAMAELPLSVPQWWMGGITADPALGILHALGSGGLLQITVGGTVTVDPVTPPPMENASCVNTWWMGTQDLALSGGVLYFGNASSILAARGTMWISAAGFGSGMIARGDELFWTYACNDDVLARPITRVFADGHAQTVAIGFCGTKPAVGFDGGLLVTNRYTGELLHVDPDLGFTTTILGAKAGLVEPIAVAVDWRNGIDVLQVGGKVARYDGDLLDLTWANDPTAPTTMTAWNNMLFFPGGNVVFQDKGGTATPFLSATATGALVDFWPGLDAMIAAAPDALFRVNVHGNVELLASAPKNATFLTGAMVPDGSYLVQVNDGGTHLMRVVP